MALQSAFRMPIAKPLPGRTLPQTRIVVCPDAWGMCPTRDRCPAELARSGASGVGRRSAPGSRRAVSV